MKGELRQFVVATAEKVGLPPEGKRAIRKSENFHLIFGRRRKLIACVEYYVNESTDDDDGSFIFESLRPMMGKTRRRLEFSADSLESLVEKLG